MTKSANLLSPVDTTRSNASTNSVGSIELLANKKSPDVFASGDLELVCDQQSTAAPSTTPASECAGGNSNQRTFQ